VLVTSDWIEHNADAAASCYTVTSSLSGGRHRLFYTCRTGQQL